MLNILAHLWHFTSVQYVIEVLSKRGLEKVVSLNQTERLLRVNSLKSGGQFL